MTKVNAVGIESVSCPVAGTCMLVTAFSNSWLYSDGKWARGKVGENVSPISVSCATANRCVTIDAYSGLAYTYTNP